MIKSFAVIVAATAKTFGIGKCGKLPWNKLPEDMAYFKNVTNSVQDPSKQNAVIMGRKTWLSIPEKFRPLEGRLNIILSRAPTFSSNDLPSSTLLARSLEEALSLLSEAELASKVENVFVIGGSGVYSEALVHPSCSKIFLTEVYGDKYEDCDTFLPPIPDCFKEASCTDVRQDKKEGASYAFKVLVRENCANGLVGHDNDTDQPNMKKLKTDPESKIGENQDTYITNDEEMQYLRCVQDIIENGALRGDRTGTGTLSKFGVQMRFSLRDNTLPLLTTKRVFWRGVAEELLWFVAGCTDARKLQEKDIHIWDGNGSKEYLDSLGFTNREEGDLGPVYGFQWRHWGAEYTNRDADYRGKGIDQLAECIEKIKNSPEDRRIILTAWNPSDLKQMALPPCHMFCQFYVANGELSCQMYQRSADMGLGVPFNIASYSLLTRIVAQVCNLQPGEFIHTIGDAHVYVNHVDALKEQLTRRPKPFPKLLINPLKTDIDSFEFSDFTVEGYNPDKTIKMKMAV